jgi:iron complex transport system substrate-binding protein
MNFLTIVQNRFRMFSMSMAVMGALLCMLPTPAAATIQIVDDLGKTVTLKDPPKRIIPLYGAFAEMLFTIGAGPRVIARTEADSHPSEIVRLPSVGTHMRPNVELIIGMKPDLVIQSGSRLDDMPELERVRAVGIPVAIFAPKSFEQVFYTMERLGVLTSESQTAQSAVADLRKRLETVRSRIADAGKATRVFFEIRAEPLTGAGRGGIVQQVLEAAGAENVVHVEKAIVQMNFETLLMEDPDVYIVQKGPMNRNPSLPSERTHFDRLKAIREERVLFVDELIFSRPGPRCVDGVELLAAKLYPERFGQ